MLDSSQQFRDALAERGIIPPIELLADGAIHRCDAEGRGGKGDAAYLLHLDGIPAGGFENWRDGLGWQNWRADIGRTLTPAEETAHPAKVEAARAQREAEETTRKAEARERAGLIWAEANPCAEHPYLTRKGVAAHGARLHHESLALPIRDAAGALHSLQFIGVDGGKKYLTGGRIRGCYFGIGKPDGVLCIVEGFATGASIREATGYAVAVAFDAGNLLSVSKSLREKFPDLSLILCADDDYLSKDNPGITKATEAAHAADGLLAIPDFGSDRPEGATDFNDLHQAQGLEAVRRCINAALNAPAAAKETPQKSLDPLPMVAAQPTQENATKGKSESLFDVVARLAGLHSLEYEKVREAEAQQLGVRVGVLDKEVSIARRTRQEDGGKAAMFPTVEPWPEPVNGAELLNEILATIKLFIVCEQETAITAALWCAFTWLVDSVQVAPLAVITAPEKRCGKSQLLNLIGMLSRRPLVASNISPAATFRVIEAHAPTLLIDEADSFFKENEELRGVINSGHTRQSAYVIRTVGDDHEPRQFSTWGAKAISGIGHLAETIMDRAVILELRRKLPSESVKRLRHAEPGLFEKLASKLARFADDAAPAIKRARPTLPDALNDRAQDNWEPLLAIADFAGGEWPQHARHAALKLSGAEQEAVSLSAELLADIREVFEHKGVDRLYTADLLQALTDDDLKPWATYTRGKPMTPRQLAKRLDEYGVSSKQIRIGCDNKKGYELGWFIDAFARYLAPSPDTPITSETAKQSGEKAVFARVSPVSDSAACFETANRNETRKPAPMLGCIAVSDKSEFSEGDGNLIEVET